MSFPKWTDAGLAIPEEVAKCFAGTARRVELPLGTPIYRLRTNRQECAGSNIWESPWWFPRATYLQILKCANQSKATIIATARRGLAVPRRFNEDFDTLVIVEVQRSGFAFVGPASGQMWSAMAGYRLPGGFDQLWIPGLQMHEVRFKFFGNMADLI